MYPRLLNLPPAGSQTFFLWGPLQTGKSTLLRQHYSGAHWLDLMDTNEFVRYAVRPALLRLEVEDRNLKEGGQVVIDEVQKVPSLLDEVRWLIENRGIRFALCGSSKRKVRRGGANLLGGRALGYELHGLTAGELGNGFSLDRILNRGYMPGIYDSDTPEKLLASYVGTYLKEEVMAEGLTRNLRVFSRFLEVAALSDGVMVNFSNTARDCCVSSPTVREYFEILEDTLLGRWLPAYRKKAKRRLITAPKFYFSDVGVVNWLTQRIPVRPKSDAYGKAFENWVFHELTCYVKYKEMRSELSYWRLASGVEVDFVLGDMQLAIEAKASPVIHDTHMKGLRSLAQEHPHASRVIVSLEARSWKSEDGILVLSAEEFVRRLWAGELTEGIG